MKDRIYKLIIFFMILLTPLTAGAQNGGDGTSETEDSPYLFPDDVEKSENGEDEEGREYPEELIDEGEEAPKYLFDMELGDVNADVFWEGYWRYRFTYGSGFELNDGNFIFPEAYPGLQNGFEFAQEPDFFLSVLLMDHYFVEFSFTEGYDKNTYAMGYVGDETTTVKEVRIGNTGIGIGEYEGIDVSSPEYNTPGVMARFETARSQHEVMLRYDPTEEQSKTFIGEYEIDEETLELPDYQQGRTFILPNENIGNLEVYVQDSSGEYSGSDGRRYTTDDITYTADLTNGFVTLVNDPDGRVLIYYSSGGSPVGDASIAEDFIMDSDARGRPDPEEDLLPFSWTENNPYCGDGTVSFQDCAQVTVNGHNALLVHNPGEFSNFQMYNRYTYYQSLSSESWRNIISLVDSGSLVDEDMDYSFDTGSDESGSSNLLTVEIENSDSRSPYNRVPFAAENPEVYGPGHETDGSKISREILIATKSDSDDYYLGTNIITGSVKVYVNGIEDKTVDVDYDSGKLYFTRYIFSDDRIVVSYRTESSGLTGGDLFIAQGNRLFLSETSTLELAESLRWTLPENEMTEESGESPGEMKMAATWFYDTENLDATVHGGMNISTSDTAGNLRIQGMEKSGYSFSVTLDSVFPAENDLTPSPEAPVGDAGQSYDSSDREDLIYKDYEKENSYGQSYLNSYDWSGVDIDGSREGPSVAAADDDDDFSSRVMVMSYDLNDGEWSAGDFTPVEDEEIDLSGYSELSFYLRRQNLGDDNLDVQVIIGDNGESEDYDDDDETEVGDDYFVYQEDITDQLPSSENTWKKVTLALSDSDWDKLTDVRSIRFLLSTAGGGSYGDLLAAGFEVEGSPLFLTVTDASGDEKDADGVSLVEKSDSSLTDSFSEVDAIFHPDDEDQKILSLDWSGLSAGDTITGESWFTGVPTGDYGEFSLYIRNRQTSGTGHIELTDSEEKGIHLDYTPGSTSWEKLTVDLQNGTAEFSGSSDVTSLAIDRDCDEFSRFTISRTVGEASGIMELDEIHFSEPLFTAGSSLETSLDYKIPGVIKTTDGGFPILADFDVKSRLNYYTWTSDSYFDQESQRIESQLSSGVDLMNVRLEGDFEMIWADSATSYAGGHLIRFPSQSRWGWVQDEYTRSFDPGDDTMSRCDTIHISPFRILSLEADTSVSTTEESITQGWGGWLSLNPGEEMNIRYAMDLYQTSEWSSDSSDYVSDWSRDFKYIKRLDNQDDVDNREGYSSLSLSRRPDPVGLEWKVELGYDASQESNWEQENQWVSDSSLPIRLEGLNTPWTITPGYRRDLSQTVYPDSYNGFSDDMNTLFTSLESQFPLTHYIPFYEIFGHRNLDEFEETLTETDDAVYKPRLYFKINRQTGSSIQDLFVPSGVDVSIEREYYCNEDSSYIQHDWNFQLVQTAVNLFGSWGRYPTFDFYATDEISSSFQIVLGGYDMWTPEPEELVYQNYITLAGEKSWSLTLENSYTRKWTGEYTQDDLAIKFGWQEAEMPYVKFPFVKYLVMKPAHMEHEESLTFTGYFDDESWDDTTYDTVMRHQSKLVITELGSISGWMALGLGGKQDVYQNGFELGLELELTF